MSNFKKIDFDQRIVFDEMHQQNFKITTQNIYKGLGGGNTVLHLQCLNDRYYLQNQQMQLFTFEKYYGTGKIKLVK